MTRRLLCSALALALCSACGEKNSLGGSVAESYDLSFDEVRALKLEDFVVVEYLRRLYPPPRDVDPLQESGVEKACKLTVDLEGLDLSGRVRLRDEAFLARVTVSRVARVGGDFPAIDSGAVRFDKLGLEDGQRVEGTFDVVFVTDSTLSGYFFTRIDNPELTPAVSATPTASPTAAATPSPSPTSEPSATPSPSPSPTSTPTPTPTG